jgi:hypothetical protein
MIGAINSGKGRQMAKKNTYDLRSIEEINFQQRNVRKAVVDLYRDSTSQPSTINAVYGAPQQVTGALFAWSEFIGEKTKQAILQYALGLEEYDPAIGERIRAAMDRALFQPGRTPGDIGGK